MTDTPPAETAPEIAPETGSATTPAAAAMPDRLSTNPRSPHFDESALRRGVGIRFKGAERRDVEEYSISEGWIRVGLGKKVDRHGNPLTIKLTGPVEAWYERPDDAGDADRD